MTMKRFCSMNGSLPVRYGLQGEQTGQEMPEIGLTEIQFTPLLGNGAAST
jgi:hypothetical protein